MLGFDVEPTELILQKRRDFTWDYPLEYPDGTPLPAGKLFLELVTGNQHNAVQRVKVSRASKGTYRLGLWGGWSIPIDYYDVTNAPQGMGVDISDAIESIPKVGKGNVVVKSVELVPEWRIKLTLNEGTNEVQRITFSDDTRSGNYKLFSGLALSENVPFKAPPESVQGIIEKFPGIGKGNVVVRSDGGTGYFVEYVNGLSHKDVPQLGAISRGFGFGLVGGFLGMSSIVSVQTVTRGTAKLGETMVNTLNKTINDFFDQFENLLGVDLTFKVTDQKNITFVATSKKSYTESDIITFSVDVTGNAIKSFLNGVSMFLGVFDMINVDFRWNHTFDVEFIGKLAHTPVPQFEVDASKLEGLDKDQEVDVQVLNEGKARLTIWDAKNGKFKVEEAEVDKIRPRTKWQLVFLPDGEPAGGRALERGMTVIQE